MYNNKSSLLREDKETQDLTINSLVKSINKEIGKGTIYNMKDAEFEPASSISTRSLGLDIATGIGGIPVGRVIEVYGPESSGKTTITLQLVAEVQSRGGKAAFLDAEHALDPAYAKALGVNMDDLLISQPNCGEDALNIVDNLVRSGSIDIVVIDSVAALVPRAELEGNMEKSHIGLQARLMSKALRKITGIAKQTNTTVVFVNQIRMKVGVMFGSPEVTTGGRALKYYTSMRIDIRRTGKISGADGEAIGNKTKVKIAKNKMAPPFRTAEFNILYGEGVDYLSELIDQAIKVKSIVKSGSWYSRGTRRLGQGVENVKSTLKGEPDLLKEIETELYNELFPKENAESLSTTK